MMVELGTSDFKPCVTYIPKLDSILVLLEDVSYRSQPLFSGCEGVMVLWHPYEDRIVGMRVNGTRND
jgi:hypothetical protein